VGVTPRARHRSAAWLAAALAPVAAASVAPAFAAGNPPVLEAALHYFTRGDTPRIVEAFDSTYPAPVTPAERERVLATLPLEGDIPDAELGGAQRRKLAASRRVLELHGREAVYALKVIEVPQAAVALHGRAVLLISKPALELLEGEELQALVAHEVAHECFWSDYFRARREGDRQRLRTLELLCDGLAIVTLRRVGIDPARLTSALEKLLRYNRERLGVALNENDYPEISERRRFVKRLAEWLPGAEVSSAAASGR
jgi:hypothetical protein